MSSLICRARIVCVSVVSGRFLLTIIESCSLKACLRAAGQQSILSFVELLAGLAYVTGAESLDRLVLITNEPTTYTLMAFSQLFWFQELHECASQPI